MRFKELKSLVLNSRIKKILSHPSCQLALFKTIAIIIVWVIALVPAWLFLVVWWLAAPVGFWQFRNLSDV